MATVTVAHHPELDVETAMAVFRTHFGGRYDVYKMKPTGGYLTVRKNALSFVERDFAVRKSRWTGVSVKLEQEKDSTSFVFSGFMPSELLGVIGFVPWVFLRPRWKAMEHEINIRSNLLKLLERVYHE